jgi:tetratricopeptide (TPR) repeat protein
MRRQVLVGWVLLTLLAAAPAVAAGPTTQTGDSGATAPAYADAIAMEHAGRFGAALGALRGMRLSPTQAAHRVALRRAIVVFAALRVYHARGELPAQEALLEQLGGQLDPVRDVELRAEQQERLQRVRDARADEANHDPGFLGDVWDAFASIAETLLSWLLVVAIVAVPVALVLFFVRRHRAKREPREGVALVLENLSAERSRRADENRLLGRELHTAIVVAARRATNDIEEDVDLVKDLDGSVSVNVRVAGDELAAFDSHLDEEKITIGPIGVSLRQLVAFVGVTTAPRAAHEFRGHLICDGATASLSARLGRDGATRDWICGEDGSRSRASVLAETAEWIVFQVGRNQISDSWPSVCSYRDARRELTRPSATADERKERLERVRRMLERSLLFDPTNRLARLELGGVLRKLGFNDEAAAQYELFMSIDGGNPLPPDVLRVARYSQALALSKIDDWRAHERARTLLEEMRDEVAHAKELPLAERRRWSELVRSAWMATKLFELERTRFSRKNDRAHRRAERLVASLREQHDWITGRGAPQDGLDWATHVQAVAVAENALGRALYLFGPPYREAIRCFETALSRAPELGDAHVNLVSALLRARSKEGSWDERIDRHLERALEISPRDRKALYLRGKAALAIGDTKAARSSFEEAAEQGDSWAQLRLAEMAWKEGDQQEAVSLVRRSIARSSAPDRRARLLVTWTAELASRGEADDDALRAARRAGRDLQRDATKRRAELADSLRRQIAFIEAKLDLQPTPEGEGHGEAG